jgi:TolB-like protein/Tfp pilus assembly protein PilF
VEGLQRRLAAILAADVVGYSRLMGEDEAGTLSILKAHRREFIEPKIAEHHGHLIKLMGDGALVEFASVCDAVACAVEIQQGMVRRNASGPAAKQVVFRVGINLGEVLFDENDIYGDGVNVAARLEALAEPGGICVSSEVHGQVEGRLNLAFEDLGERRVKNIARPLRVYRVSMAPADAPIARTAPDAGPSLPLPDRPSIAVLPFVNLSGDSGQEYLSDGISEDIITALSRFRWFFVIARNSSFAYKGTAVDATQVARELGVQYLLVGSVRRAGDRVRVTAQLVETGSGHQVWAERYDRNIDDIFALQDDITESIVSTVGSEFLSAEMRRAQRAGPQHLSAWHCLMRAGWHHARYTRADVIEAQRLLRQALDLDPASAQSCCLLAFTHLMQAQFGWSESTEESIAEAVLAAGRALELDNRDAWAHTAMGLVDLISYRHDQAIARFEKATDLNPSLAHAHAALGQALVLAGEHERAEEQIRRAIRLSPRDPFSVYWYAHLGLAAFVAERYEEAIDWAGKTIQQNPNFPGGHRLLASSLGHLGQLAEARQALDQLLRLMPGMQADDVRRQVPFKKAADMERYLDGLRKAGLAD